MQLQIIQTRSRLRFSQVLTTDGVEYWDQVAYPEIPLQPGDHYYTLTDADTLDTIAAETYGDPSLQWVLAVANGIDLWPMEVHSGDQIRIPDKAYVNTILPKRGNF